MGAGHFGFNGNLLAGWGDDSGHYSNAFVAAGSVTLGGSLSDYGSNAGATIISAAQLDTAPLSSGMQFPLIVASSFGGSFPGYFWGADLTDYGNMNLPAPPTGTHWDMNIVPATLDIFTGAYDLTPGSQSALVLEISDNQNRGMAMLASAGPSAASFQPSAVLVSSVETQPAPDSGTAAPATTVANLHALVIGDFGVKVSWSSPTTAVTGFEIQRKAGDGSWLTVYVAGARAQYWLDTHVTSGVAYDYRILPLTDSLDADFTQLSSPVNF